MQFGGTVAGELIESGAAAGDQEQDRADRAGDLGSLPAGPVNVLGREAIAREGESAEDRGESNQKSTTLGSAVAVMMSLSAR